MKHLLRKCFSCGLYTLKQECPRCNNMTHDPHPPKFSPDDRYARYRIADRYREGAEVSEDGMGKEMMKGISKEKDR